MGDSSPRVFSALRASCSAPHDGACVVKRVRQRAASPPAERVGAEEVLQLSSEALKNLRACALARQHVRGLLSGVRCTSAVLQVIRFFVAKCTSRSLRILASTPAEHRGAEEFACPRSSTSTRSWSVERGPLYLSGFSSPSVLRRKVQISYAEDSGKSSSRARRRCTVSILALYHANTLQRRNWKSSGGVLDDQMC